MDMDESSASAASGDRAPEERTEPPPSNEGTRARLPVFLSDFVYLPRPLVDLEPALMDADAGWLDLVASRISRKGPRPIPAHPGEEDEAARETVSKIVMIPLGLGPEIARPLAAVTAFRPRRRERSIVVPIEWRPVQLENLIPVFEGDLELTDLDETSSRLGMNAIYRAPFGRIGVQLDRIAMGRLAESAVRHFLETLGEVLTDAGAAG